MNRWILLVAFCVLSSTLLVRPVAASPNAIIQKDAGYVDISGYYHVVGEVNNTGDTWLQFIQISTSLKDGKGVVVDIKPAYTYLVNLPPKGTAGFDAVELNTTLSATIRSYTLTITYQIAQPESEMLRISNLSNSTDILGWLELNGQVTNNGDSISENTFITGTFYGADGKVVYVAISAPTQASIQPHTSQSFTLSVLDPTRAKLVTGYSISAESSQYVSTS